ncbi:hypothetical protein ACFC63_06490 [Streptomyces albidoflavus]
MGLLDHALAAWMRDAMSAGGGSRASFAEGARSAPAELTAALGPGRDAVVFTSAGSLAATGGALLSLPDKGVVALNRVAVNASVTTLAAGGSGTTLLTFNAHAHFAGDLRPVLTCRWVDAVAGMPTGACGGRPGGHRDGVRRSVACVTPAPLMCLSLTSSFNVSDAYILAPVVSRSHTPPLPGRKR